jgi:Nucleotidyltransferase of unknown function (DUF6036)
MTKEQLHGALTRLGQILRERRVTGEIAVFGGAAIVLGFDFRRATQDVEGHGQVMEAAQEDEKELHLPPIWLNKQANSYLSQPRDFTWFHTYPSEGQFGLRVLIAEPEYLLAMKLFAFRLYTQDTEDIVLLARRLKRTTAEDLVSLLKYYYPDEEIPQRKLAAIREVARQISATGNCKRSH